MDYNDSVERQRIKMKGIKTGSISRMDSTPQDWVKQGRALAETGFSAEDVKGIVENAHPDIAKVIIKAHADKNYKFYPYSNFAFRK